MSEVSKNPLSCSVEEGKSIGGQQMPIGEINVSCSQTDEATETVTGSPKSEASKRTKALSIATLPSADVEVGKRHSPKRLSPKRSQERCARLKLDLKIETQNQSEQKSNIITGKQLPTNDDLPTSESQPDDEQPANKTLSKSLQLQSMSDYKALLVPSPLLGLSSDACSFSIKKGCLKESHLRGKETRRVSFRGDDSASQSQSRNQTPSSSSDDLEDMSLLAQRLRETAENCVNTWQILNALGPRNVQQYVQSAEESDNDELDEKTTVATYDIKNRPKFRNEFGIVYPDDTYRWTLQTILIFITLANNFDIVFWSTNTGWHRHDSYQIPLSVWIMWSVCESVLFILELWFTRWTGHIRCDSANDNDPDVLLKEYIHSWLLIDCITAFPFELVALIFSRSYYHSLRVVKLLRVVRVPWFLESTSSYWDRSNVVKGFIITFYVINSVFLLSIGWLLLNGPTITSFVEIQQQTAFEELTHAVYFVMTTLTTLGYGGIYPTTLVTQWYAISLEVIGCVGSCCISVAVCVLLEEEPIVLKAKQDRRKLASIMKINDVPWKLQQHCFALLPNLLEISLADSEVVLKELPPTLSNSIRHYMKIGLISKLPLFQGLSLLLCSKLASSLRNVSVPPKKLIIKIGEVADEMFFLGKGCVEVTKPAITGGERWLATLQMGSYFGEVGLVNKVTRNANVRSIVACMLFVLKKDHFLDLIANSPELLERVRLTINKRIGRSVCWGQEKTENSESERDLEGFDDELINHIHRLSIDHIRDDGSEDDERDSIMLT